MGLQFLGILVIAGFGALLLSAVPLVLRMIGVFDKLGKTKIGTKVATELGSLEPSKFAMNFCRVTFFLLISFYVITGIARDATQYEIHKPVITQMESSNNSFYATQVSFGEWAIIEVHNNGIQNLNITNSSFNFSDLKL